MRALRFLLVAALVLGSVAAGGSVFLIRTQGAELIAELEALREAKAPLAVEDLAGPAVKTEENAAPLYRAVTARVVKTEPAEFERVMDYIDGKLTRTDDIIIVESLIDRHRKFLDEIVEASARPACRSDVRRMDPGELLPAETLIQFAKLLAARAKRAGRPGGARDLTAVLRLSRHLASDPVTISQQYSWAAVELAFSVYPSVREGEPDASWVMPLFKRALEGVRIVELRAILAKKSDLLRYGKAFHFLQAMNEAIKLVQLPRPDLTTYKDRLGHRPSWTQSVFFRLMNVDQIYGLAQTAAAQLTLMRVASGIREPYPEKLEIREADPAGRTIEYLRHPDGFELRSGQVILRVK